jgi:hypothetical protein
MMRVLMAPAGQAPDPRRQYPRAAADRMFVRVRGWRAGWAAAAAVGSRRPRRQRGGGARCRRRGPACMHACKVWLCVCAPLHMEPACHPRLLNVWANRRSSWPQPRPPRSRSIARVAVLCTCPGSPPYARFHGAKRIDVASVSNTPPSRTHECTRLGIETTQAKDVAIYQQSPPESAPRVVWALTRPLPQDREEGSSRAAPPPRLSRTIMSIILPRHSATMWRSPPQNTAILPTSHCAITFVLPG